MDTALRETIAEYLRERDIRYSVTRVPYRKWHRLVWEKRYMGVRALRMRVCVYNLRLTDIKNGRVFEMKARYHGWRKTSFSPPQTAAEVLRMAAITASTYERSTGVEDWYSRCASEEAPSFEIEAYYKVAQETAFSLMEFLGVDIYRKLMDDVAAIVARDHG